MARLLTFRNFITEKIADKNESKSWYGLLVECDDCGSDIFGSSWVSVFDAVCSSELLFAPAFAWLDSMSMKLVRTFHLKFQLMVFSRLCRNLNKTYLVASIPMKLVIWVYFMFIDYKVTIDIIIDINSEKTNAGVNKNE